MLTKGDSVRSTRFGLGEVVVDLGPTAVVRFGHGVEECLSADLERVISFEEALARPEWPSPAAAVSRALGEAIRSVNNAWGVFARSKIDLLPHQLWVCHRVNRERPARWLVADDVGLGKTIEAGLILMPLIASGEVKRLLILCPASLVEQWQYRMRTMFDIRVATYSSQSDTPKADFWAVTPMAVASLHTLRANADGRHERMLSAEPWDLVVVDEAHHLNADEERGPTLGYKLIDKLLVAGRVRSMVFFTGTPHRGKNFGFLALMRLLRPDLFDPRRPIDGQLCHLACSMIRNNKQSVTDLAGNRLFLEPHVRPETYSYSPEEDVFYATLTDFILTGKAYAKGLSETQGRAVMLVLIAMQKLASSSVAAIRRALHGRLARIVAGRKRLAQLERDLAQLQDQETDFGEETDGIAELEARIAEQSAQVVLMADEKPRLKELVAVADRVTAETKVAKIIGLIGNGGPFVGRSVLFFTEYKATQSLLLTELQRKFGLGCATFINGDERADDVSDGVGPPRSLSVRRERAADLFNTGAVRFLVSTEAGGEGIDLQANCHSLIHVDLPWNPMRLHQRVGRVNRYGQKHRVEVFTLRNPDTVESRIWDKLNSKIERIMRALQEVMAEPEDLLQLVLGMASPGLFRDVFASAPGVRPESFDSWFNAETSQFGGRDALTAVRDLIGHCARFDFREAAPQIPRLDLPDLESFFRLMLVRQGRQVRTEADGLAFKTPDGWADFPGARRDYAGLVFDRGTADTQRILGVGHRLVDRAISTACDESESIAGVSAEALPAPVYVFRIHDRITGTNRNIRSVIVAVEVSQDGPKLIRDWELIHRLNPLAQGRSLLRQSRGRLDAKLVIDQVKQAANWIGARIGELDHPFQVPEIGLCCALIPIPLGQTPNSLREPS